LRSPHITLLRRPVAAVAVLAAGLLAYGAYGIVRHGLTYSGGSHEDARHLVVCGLAVALLLARAWAFETDRWVWVAFAAGMAFNGLGDAIWMLDFASGVAVSPADGAWAASYACYFAALGLYRRGRVRDSFGTFSLDLVGVPTYLLAILAAVLLPSMLAHGASAFTATINLFYVCADIAIVSVVLAVASMTGRRVGRQDGLLCVAFAVTLIADGLSGASDLPGVLNLVWEAGFLLVGLAAWGTPTAAGALRVGGWWELFPSLSWLAGGLGVLIAGELTYVHPIALGLAVVAVVAAGARMVLITREVRKLVVLRQELLIDALTGLPNRAALQRELELLTHDGTRSRERADLVLLDIEHFKEVNSALGNEAGDAMLRALGGRLAPIAPGLLARHSGDGLAAVVQAPHDPHEVARALLDALADPVSIEGVAVAVTAVAGIARFPDDATTAGELSRRAQVALAEAKRLGVDLNRYDPGTDGQSRKRLAMAADLREALSGTPGLWVAFQPQVEIATCAVIGAEALIRWTHPQLGTITPDVLLPVAERTGLMPALTDWVFDRALEAAASWREHLTVSVNVSAGSLVDAMLPGRIAAALERHGVTSSRLVIEVTEQSVMTDFQRCSDVLARLRALGIAISVDDFGTGNSSLIQLKQNVSTELKVDKSFVIEMGSSAVDREIVGAVVTMGRRLGRRVVAEGVETPAIWQALAKLRCDIAQGYGIGRPMPATDLTRFLATPPDFLATLGGHLQAA
jgi:diguanylate cyclase (GGDEF)-like protein